MNARNTWYLENPCPWSVNAQIPSGTAVLIGRSNMRSRKQLHKLRRALRVTLAMLGYQDFVTRAVRLHIWKLA